MAGSAKKGHPTAAPGPSTQITPLKSSIAGDKEKKEAADLPSGANRRQSMADIIVGKELKKKLTFRGPRGEAEGALSARELNKESESRGATPQGRAGSLTRGASSEYGSKVSNYAELTSGFMALFKHCYENERLMLEVIDMLRGSVYCCRPWESSGLTAEECRDYLQVGRHIYGYPKP
jgi:hypothetical protein